MTSLISSIPPKGWRRSKIILTRQTPENSKKSDDRSPLLWTSFPSKTKICSTQWTMRVKTTSSSSRTAKRNSMLSMTSSPELSTDTILKETSSLSKMPSTPRTRRKRVWKRAHSRGTLSIYEDPQTSSYGEFPVQRLLQRARSREWQWQPELCQLRRTCWWLRECEPLISR